MIVKFPSDGMYAMHHMNGIRPGSIGTLVLLRAKPDGEWFSVDYVPSGGSSSAWPAAEFTVVTDPVLIAITKWHAAEREKRECESRVRALSTAAEKWKGVEQCLRESAELLPDKREQ